MLRHVRNILIAAPLLLALYAVMQPGEVTALPLFARKYSVPCTTCHFAFPRLNKFGMDFRQRGYRMPGDKGESPWQAKEFPLSLVGDVGYNYTSIDQISSDSTAAPGTRERFAISAFQQNAVEFHTAGTLGENLTFHFDNNFSGIGGPLGSGMAFVQFDDVVKDGALNVKAGVYDAEIPYLADSRKTTLASYLSPVTLDGRGVELNGTHTGWTYAAGLINSERTLGKPGDKSLNTFENTYVWLMRDVHGTLVTARWYADHQDPRKLDARSSLHTQMEVSAFIDLPHAQIIPGYTYQKFADQAAENELHTGLIEALVQFGGGARWLATARYELQHAAKTDLNPIEDHNAEVLGLAYYLSPNMRLAGEWSHDADNFQGPRTDMVQAYVHLGY